MTPPDPEFAAADEESAERPVEVKIDQDTQASASPTSAPTSGKRALDPNTLLGSIVAEKYRVDSILGRGGMGVVVGATHVVLKERVALKFLRDTEEEGQFHARFRREAQICARLRNEHITKVIDVGTAFDSSYIVMEYLDGLDLRQFVREQGQLLPLATAIDIVVQVCEGLAEAHGQGIVHRDLKPSNLFVVRRPDGTQLVKILDFGISKWLADPDAEEEELTKTGAVLGSPKYMAPEQLFGSSKVDPRADVWSVGAILYELLTGKVPFEQPTFPRLCAELASGRPPKPPRVHRPDLPEELDALVMLCLQLDIETRLPNVAVLAGELLAAVSDPKADVVRQRLETALEAVPSSLSTTGSMSMRSTQTGMRSGDYVAASLALARTGETPRAEERAPAIVVPAEPLTPAPAPPRRRGLLLVGLGAVTLLVLAFVFLRRAPEAASSSPASAPVASTGATKATAAVTSVEPVASPAATTLAPAVTTTTAPVVAASTGTTTTAVAKPNPGGGGQKKPPTPPASTTTPAPTVAPTVVPPPPTAAPTPTKPVNPLEDRQ